MLALGVEQPAIGAADAIGPKRLFEVVRLKEDGESGERVRVSEIPGQGFR
jgi:hypothetical protein